MTDETDRLSGRAAAHGASDGGAMGVARRRSRSTCGMDEATLTTLLGTELDQAEADANTKVAQALFTMATQQNNVAAAIFWMKARRWLAGEAGGGGDDDGGDAARS